MHPAHTITGSDVTDRDDTECVGDDAARGFLAALSGGIEYRVVRVDTGRTMTAQGYHGLSLNSAGVFARKEDAEAYVRDLAKRTSQSWMSQYWPGYCIQSRVVTPWTDIEP